MWGLFFINEKRPTRYAEFVLTAGVDLAAEPKGTALAVIDWQDSRAVLVELTCGVNDEVIVEASQDVSKIGIDCALGWPRDFVDFLVQHSQVRDVLDEVDGGMNWRRKLSYRETDRHVREFTGRWPLSVATDRLGVTALRAAGLLSRLGNAGVDIDRSGSGTVVEVYPGASLRLWGLSTTGYKTSSESRATLVRALMDMAPWMELGSHVNTMIESADALDAVVAAFAARSAALGLSTEASDEHRAQAQIEGWIALPTQPLSSLISASRG